MFNHIFLPYILKTTHTEAIYKFKTHIFAFSHGYLDTCLQTEAEVGRDKDQAYVNGKKIVFQGSLRGKSEEVE